MYFSLEWSLLKEREKQKKKKKKEHRVRLKPIHGRPRARDTECVYSAFCAAGQGGCWPKELEEHLGRRLLTVPGVVFMGD